MIKRKPIPEGRQCNHVTCGTTCHREPPEPKKRKLIPRSVKPKDLSLALWFIERAKELTGVCVNCQGKSNAGHPRLWKWSICHVLPKHEFPSVKTHPMNFIELCTDCHTEFDSTFEKAKKMKCWKIAVYIYWHLKPFVKESHKILNHFNEKEEG